MEDFVAFAYLPESVALATPQERPQDQTRHKKNHRGLTTTAFNVVPKYRYRIISKDADRYLENENFACRLVCVKHETNQIIWRESLPR
jgi:hypothetical protein